MLAGVDALARIRAVVGLALARRGLRRLHVAFSGGPDSSVLADAAAAALGAAEVVLLHIDHGAPASAAARAHAEAWAAARGHPLRAAAVTVGPGASWEAQARAARDRALVALAPGELIATAHTATDQAETVLLRLARGSGPAGLAGIAPLRGVFLRPLLDVTRADVLAYAVAAGLAPWRDPMNDDLRFARVRVRRETLPALRALNPRIDDALCRLAAAAAEDARALDAAVAPVHAAARRGAALACAPIAAAPPAIAKRALAQWLRPALGADATHLDALLALARGPDHGTRGLDLPGGRVERVYDRLVRTPAAPVRPDVVAPAIEVDGPDRPYTIRPWRPGDRMRPARLRGHSRKLSDLYVDHKVPRASRAHARVVERAEGTIVWAEHIGLAHDVEVTIRIRAHEDGGADDVVVGRRTTRT